MCVVWFITELPIRIYKEIDAAIVGGTEILRGLRAARISRRKLAQDAVTEEHTFVGHRDRVKIFLNDAIRIGATRAGRSSNYQSESYRASGRCR